ncbi:MAG: 2-oxoacid:acceptor oxidoreductase subunit alpha [Bacteroidales bacterium]|nr:2-oxoacid:acceptor oxidoreductase subunit alpha [Bacteroidales bacterium]MBN2697315.1 2-oxoacid:acceptor oxidoreductase subunit alpha [Bacteroidales bacterium]
MAKNPKVVELEEVVVKFAGDSGDGMQLTGTQFSDTSAFVGNDLSTFPDYPSEIRAPQGTIAGVSGFQVHIGHREVTTPGDQADVLVAMNPAALKANMKWVKQGATLIIDIDNFDNKHYKKAGYIEDPLHDNSLDGYNVVKAPITNLTRDTIKQYGLDLKIADKTKNQFVAGILYWLFNRDLKIGEDFLKQKFRSKPDLVKANIAVLHAGYNYAETIEVLSTTFHVHPVKDKHGLFRNITGNQATAWGLLAAAEKAGLELFLGSYPITPASEILQELSKLKSLGAITFQAEDEIAGICSSIGASFAGRLAVTSTSGPGLALKSEGIGLAVMTELPIVIVDVQRGGPATGLPTKTEQGDLMQALYGRNGESPCIVMAASSPANCFNFAFKAAKLAVEHMTPVILLSDSYLANGSELWEIPFMKDLEEIHPPFAEDNDPNYYPYLRDPKRLNRFWARPGQPGLRHRVGGLEKADVTGEVSHDPMNHQIMVETREAKVQKVAEFIPDQEIIGDKKGDLLVVGWGGTYGAIFSAVNTIREQGRKVSMAQFNYIKPLPKNTREVLSGFKKILVCELNLGQFASYLRSQLPEFNYAQFNKVQGLPMFISEIKQKIEEVLDSMNSEQ